jgi:hypothetical protein
VLLLLVVLASLAGLVQGRLYFLALKRLCQLLLLLLLIIIIIITVISIIIVRITSCIKPP